MRLEAHAVLSGTAPITAGFGASGVTSSGTNGHRRVDLHTEVLQSELADDDVRLWAEVDRLNARFEHRRFSLTVGRQPITWGVNYFWPVLDLFGPFSPAAVDRDYKPGVDALRLSVPVGDFSEIQLIAAAQGDEATAAPDSNEDWSYGALGRFHLSGTDVGVMLGNFYRDRTGGLFVTGDAGGLGLRGEVLYTDVAPEWIGLPGEDQSTFWRATIGVDALLSPRVSLITEASWNGYGAKEPGDYPRIAVSTECAVVRSPRSVGSTRASRCRFRRARCGAWRRPCSPTGATARPCCSRRGLVTVRQCQRAVRCLRRLRRRSRRRRPAAIRVRRGTGHRVGAVKAYF